MSVFLSACLSVCTCIYVYLPSGDGIFNSIGEGMSHVQAAGDIGRGKAEHEHTLWVWLRDTLTLDDGKGVVEKVRDPLGTRIT